ncbi:ChaN family lipoprotein [bacterium]|nr:ChaN family lipoprotein [bacterium]
MKLASPRAELLKIQQQIFKQNKRMIGSQAMAQDRAFLAYERAYQNAVKNYRKIVPVEEVVEAIRKADIIFVGDYHTLNQSQRSFLRVLRSYLPVSDEFAIAFELVQARYQQFLDKYMKGAISELTFLRKIEFKEHWYFDLWKNFEFLFYFAKQNNIPVFGIDPAPNEYKGIEKRDKLSAKNIFEIHQKSSGRKLFVFTGDLHLAPNHLPKEVKEIFNQKKIKLKTLTLYQNSESIYWKLAERGLEDKAMVVKISNNEFCRMNTPPIIAQQSYLNWLENEGETLEYADSKQTILQYIDRISSFLNIEIGKEKEDIEVFTCGDLSFFKYLRGQKGFMPRELKIIRNQVLRSESYTIPSKKIIYLANVSINHAAEEATHMLRALCAGHERPRATQDAFYANILHEAMGYFGSKIINHKRKCPRTRDFRRMLREYEFPKNSLPMQVAALYMEHRKKIRKGEFFHANKISPMSADLFLGLSHAIGYYLGEKMFYGLLYEKISRDEMRDLFCDPMEEDGAPSRVYYAFQDKLKGLKLPIKV